MTKRQWSILFAVMSLSLATLVATAVQHGGDLTPDPVDAAAAGNPIRFQPVEIWIDTGATPLAAYQIEITATQGNVQIVGIEGGAHAQFADPPYYDTRAMQSNRVIIADFSTAPVHELPSGQVRIVTLHVQMTGSEPAEFRTELQAAADVDGTPIPATIALVQETQS